MLALFSDRFRSLARLGAALAMTTASFSAQAAVYGHHVIVTPVGVHRSTTVATPRGVVHTSSTISRGRPGWRRGGAAFVGYTGRRRGYYFAPGYGYYAVPRGHVRTTWVAGSTLAPPMRRYVVVRPGVYGLAAAPAGYGWYYAGPNIVLVRRSSGVIVRSVHGRW